MTLRFWKVRRLREVAVFVLTVQAGLAVSFVMEHSFANGRVLRGVSLAKGTSVSGLSEREVVDLAQARASKVASMRIILRLRDQRSEFQIGELGVQADGEGLAREALTLGRKGGLVDQVGFWMASLFVTTEVSPEISVNRNILEGKLQPWVKKFLIEPRAPSITFQKKLNVQRGTAGEVVDWERLSSSLVAFVRSPERELPVPIRRKEALVPASIFREKTREAERYVEAPVRLRFEGQEFSLPSQALGGAIEGKWKQDSGHFELILSLEHLRAEMRPFLSKFEREPVEARFDFPSTEVVKVSESEDGLVLDGTQFLARLARSVRSDARVVELPFVQVPPQMSKKEADGLGVQGLVASFVTRHSCCQPRVKNIHRAAQSLDGVVLRSGETFSLNQHLGPRTRASGYEKAPTIVRGKMKDVFGGGISQLATTLFNAVLRGGYEIVQRQPHSVYFSRYPEGHEATVSFPEPDLIFRNDTKAAMVLKAQTAPTFIKLLIYGNNEERIVQVNKSKRYRIVQPPKEYEPDESMLPNESKRVRAGQLGWTILVSRKVTNVDGTTKEEKREVIYKPRPESLRVHPCMIPSGERGHTGESCPEPEREEVAEELSDDVYYETTVGAE